MHRNSGLPSPLLDIALERAQQLVQRTPVDIAFEFDDLIDRIPEAHPSPVVEFRLFGLVQFNLTVIRFESQQKPFLFLANTKRVLVVANIILR